MGSKIWSVEHDKGWYHEVKKAANASVSIIFSDRPYGKIAENFNDNFFDILIRHTEN